MLVGVQKIQMYFLAVTQIKFSIYTFILLTWISIRTKDLFLSIYFSILVHISKILTNYLLYGEVSKKIPNNTIMTNMNVFHLMAAIFSFAFGYPLLRYLWFKCFPLVAHVKDLMQKSKAKAEKKKQDTIDKFNALVANWLGSVKNH